MCNKGRKEGKKGKKRRLIYVEYFDEYVLNGFGGRDQRAAGSE